MEPEEQWIRDYELFSVTELILPLLLGYDRDMQNENIVTVVEKQSAEKSVFWSLAKVYFSIYTT